MAAALALVKDNSPLPFTVAVVGLVSSVEILVLPIMMAPSSLVSEEPPPEVKVIEIDFRYMAFELAFIVILISPEAEPVKSLFLSSDEEPRFLVVLLPQANAVPPTETFKVADPPVQALTFTEVIVPLIPVVEIVQSEF